MLEISWKRAGSAAYFPLGNRQLLKFINNLLFRPKYSKQNFIDYILFGTYFPPTVLSVLFSLPLIYLIKRL